MINAGFVIANNGVKLKFAIASTGRNEYLFSSYLRNYRTNRDHVKAFFGIIRGVESVGGDEVCISCSDLGPGAFHDIPFTVVCFVLEESEFERVKR
jgi:hypothetical protein